MLTKEKGIVNIIGKNDFVYFFLYLYMYMLFDFCFSALQSKDFTKSNSFLFIPIQKC